MILADERLESGHLLVLSGRLDASTSDGLAQRLDALAASGIAVVLDCADVSVVTSVGLRALLVGAKKAKASGGTIVCCALQPTVRQVFDLSGFGAVFPVYPDRTAALLALE